ncbi:DUF2065 domain-containing protein [Thalassotalea eurytherma]|uniref:DUF2065 domain-containing protein n=1 Tax=Thalassotalea eurytherma TaxID=1144278 RepID=A0ABQ6H2B1_9GAMM|nr:DUF2065 domain-containing protein [Thalassotalea eurytherma]GLX82049.1 hypothetical protein theurythT_15010 [Thalassotalea eurytherma]
MSLELLLTAFAIALIIEGIVPALFPNKWRAYVAKIAQEPTANIRNIGLSIMVIGAVLLWMLN